MEINKTPVLYLGKDRNSDTFYFYGSKEGIGRFLKFVKYPMWCGVEHIGNFIDMTAMLPEAVAAEILEFVNGRVRYEIEPKRRGRPEKVVRHETEQSAQESSDTVRPPENVAQEAVKPKRRYVRKVNPEGNTGDSRRGVRGVLGDSDRSSGPTSGRGFSDDTVLLDGKRSRTRKRSPRVVESAVEPKPVLLVTPAPKRRGRPRKLARAE